MSTTLRGPPPVKKISSWVRPGVREVRARFLRPVSALIRLDLPTLERPDSAISAPRIGGRDTAEPAAAVKRHSPVNSLRPASCSLAVNSVIVVILSEIASQVGLADLRAKMPDARRSRKHLEEHQACGFFFTNSALILSINSILAPCLRMITLCCSTDSELFQAQ